MKTRSSSLARSALVLVGCATATDPAARPERVGIPPGRSIAVDGTIAADEWDDAQRIDWPVQPGWNVEVRVKHDGEHLLVAFSGLRPPTGSPAVAFPELLVDVRDDKTAALGSDDWWFHVSVTDCQGIGALDVYDACVPEAVGWAANNFPPGQPIDVVEMRIAFATIGWTPAHPSIGLALRLSDTQGWARHHAGAAQPQRPATWPSYEVLQRS